MKYLFKKYAVFLLLCTGGMLQLSAQLVVWPDTLNFGDLDIDSLKYYRAEINFKNTDNVAKTVRYSSFFSNLYVVSFSADSAPPATIQSVYNAFVSSNNPNASQYTDLVQLPNNDFVLGPGEELKAYIFLYPDRELQLHYQGYAGKYILFTTSGGGPLRYVQVKYNFRQAINWTNNNQYLGHCRQGDTLKAVFNYTNTTGKTLSFAPNPKVIDNHNRIVFKDRILPYSTGSLPVFINTSDYEDSVAIRLSIIEKNSHDAYYQLTYGLDVDSVKNYTRIEFEQTRLYRRIRRGDQDSALYYFKFKNTGTTPLIICACRSSCDCITPVCPTKPIAPGQSATICAHYDVNRMGPFIKTISVSTNDRHKPNISLYVSGEVYEP